MTISRSIVTAIACGFLELGAMTNGQASPPDAEHALAANPLWEVPLGALGATRERPLFSPSRRPPAAPVLAAVSAPAPAASVKAPEPDRPPLSILGTVVGRSDAIGVFMEDANKNVLRLHAGQNYAGWVLRAVERRQVNFAKGDAVATLTLPAPGEEKPIAPTAGTPPGKQPVSSLAPAAIAQISPSATSPRQRHRGD